MGDYAVDTSTTEVVPPTQRAEFWLELISSYHRRLGYLHLNRHDLKARTVRQRTDRYQLVEWTQDSDVWFQRTPGHIREDDDGDYRLALPVKGQLVVRQRDSATQLRRRTAALFTMNEPFCLGAEEPTRGLVLTIPHSDVHDRLKTSSAPHARTLDLRVGLGRVVHDLIVGLVEERDELSRYHFDAVCERLVELLCLLVVGDHRPNAPGCLADVEAMVLRYVREHASDPQLNGEMVARELGWSLRQIQRALRTAGTTPRVLIREERLRLARERLQSPAFRQWTITAVAHSCGFSSHSMLSNAFRERYGLPPSELR